MSQVAWQLAEHICTTCRNQKSPEILASSLTFFFAIWRQDFRRLLIPASSQRGCACVLSWGLASFRSVLPVVQSDGCQQQSTWRFIKYSDAKTPILACFGALASEYFMNRQVTTTPSRPLKRYFFFFFTFLFLFLFLFPFLASTYLSTSICLIA